MRGRLFFGTFAVGFLALCSHGQTPGDKPEPGGEGQPAVAKGTVPQEL